MGLIDAADGQHFPANAEVVWSHLQRVAARLGKVRERDDYLKRLTVSTGMSAFSWGEKVTVSVEPTGPDSSRVTIGSRLKLGVNVAGSSRNAANIAHILSALSASLQRGDAPPFATPRQDPLVLVLRVLVAIGLAVGVYFLLRHG